VAVLQARSFATVSTLGIPASAPAGNAESITNALLGKSKTGRAAVLGAATTGFFSYDEPSCGRGVGSGSVNIGAALGGAALGSVPVVGGALKGLFGAFTAHHAQAVKTEQATLCQAVPDANNFLRSIDALVASGQLDTASAVNAMQQGFQQWRSAEIARILKDTGGKCNAACVYEKCFQAAIEKRKLDYASASVQNTRGANGVIGGAVNLLTGAPASSVSAGVTPLYSGAPAAAPAYVGGVPSGIVSAIPGAPVQAGLGVMSALPQNSGVLLIGVLFVAVIGSAIFFRRK
jgi:hypothetical protein